MPRKLRKFRKICRVAASAITVTPEGKGFGVRVRNDGKRTFNGADRSVGVICEVECYTTAQAAEIIGESEDTLIRRFTEALGARRTWENGPWYWPADQVESYVRQFWMPLT